MSSEDFYDDNATSCCSSTTMQAVANLQKLRIQFVAFDFDHTILSIHTGGWWENTAESLAKHVRPQIKELLPCLLKQKDMHLAVVTFSSQPDMVRAVVETMLPPKNPNNAHQAMLPIRADDSSWKIPNPIHRQEHWWKEDEADIDVYEIHGKQPHMLSAIHELEFLVEGLRITKSTSLLIDDDPDNIRIAVENGVRAVWLDPDHPERLFSDLSKLT
jgi:hypothetical protein